MPSLGLYCSTARRSCAWAWRRLRSASTSSGVLLGTACAHPVVSSMRLTALVRSRQRITRIALPPRDAGSLNHAIAQHADTFDFDLHDVARLQSARGLWCACENE